MRPGPNQIVGWLLRDPAACINIFHKGKFEGASKNNKTILNTKDISSCQNVVSVLMTSMKIKKHVMSIFTNWKTKVES